MQSDPAQLKLPAAEAPSPDPTSARQSRATTLAPPLSAGSGRTRVSRSSAALSSNKLAKSMTKLGTVVYADGMQQLTDAHTLAVASGTQLVHCLTALEAIESKVGTAQDTVTDVHDTVMAVHKAGQLRLAALALRRAVDVCDSAAQPSSSISHP